MVMKSECRQIIKDTLVEYSYDNDAQVINLTSEVSQDLLAEAIEERLKSKFYVFRVAVGVLDEKHMHLVANVRTAIAELERQRNLLTDGPNDEGR